MKKWLIIILSIIVGIGIAIGGYLYSIIYSPNVSNTADTHTVDIYPNTNIESLAADLSTEGIIKDKDSFLWVAKLMKYNVGKIRNGRFQVKAGWSNRKLISHLRTGEQFPVKITLNSKRTIEDLGGEVAKHFAFDSITIVDNFVTNEEYLQKIGYTYETIMSLFIPNTYQIYWNITPEKFMERMIMEHKKFWSKKGRLDKAKSINMTQNEVYTLASIVEKETHIPAEKPIVAGVYMNRLEKGIILQADPTVIFATRDFTIRRVLNKHLQIDSPYNTYKYAGLPPGPISMASISSIDAVLNYGKHDYYYFCAKPGAGGTNFAKTLRQHNNNARKYRNWLNKERIMK